MSAHYRFRARYYITFVYYIIYIVIRLFFLDRTPAHFERRLEGGILCRYFIFHVADSDKSPRRRRYRVYTNNYNTPSVNTLTTNTILVPHHYCCSDSPDKSTTRVYE
uniref:Uncharacterized protein n=1 Tax=Schizaphis graminum TaxID=13262 RepID=A0A2S2N7I5_SCHGA